MTRQAPHQGHALKLEAAPSPLVPLAFFLSATAALVAAFAVASLHPHAFLRHWVHNGIVLAALHLFVLGWGTTLATGAIYQMAPVVLHARLCSERLALIHLGIHAAGVALLVTGFWWLHTPRIIAGACLLATAVLVFAVHLALTLRGRAHPDRVGAGMAIAAAYLVLTAGWGLTLALNLRWGFIRAIGPVTGSHLALGAGGWFTVLIAFVSLKLTPLFAVGAPPPGRAARPVLAALAAVPLGLALAGSFLPPAARNPAVRVLAAAGAVAACPYARLVWRSAPRRAHRRLEPPVRFALAGSALFAALAVVGAAGYTGLAPGLFSRPERLIAWVYAALVGWVGTVTIGQLYRILPFIVWLERFRKHTPGEQLPFLHEIADRRLGDALLALWLGGLAVGAAGLWVRSAALVGAGMAAGLGGGLLLAYAEARALTVWQAGVRWPKLPPRPAQGAVGQRGFRG